MNLDRFDLDPAPLDSPRLYAEIDAIPYARPKPASYHVKPKPTEAQRTRLARDLAIYLSIEGGMSQRVAAKAFGLSQPGILKAYHRMSRRKSRV